MRVVLTSRIPRKGLRFPGLLDHTWATAGPGKCFTMLMEAQEPRWPAPGAGHIAYGSSQWSLCPRGCWQGGEGDLCPQGSFTAL